GIRARNVTGVQTCALPIWFAGAGVAVMINVAAIICLALLAVAAVLCLIRMVIGPTMLDRAVASDVFIAVVAIGLGVEAALNQHEIGRASCRERVESGVVGV